MKAIIYQHLLHVVSFRLQHPRPPRPPKSYLSQLQHLLSPSFSSHMAQPSVIVISRSPSTKSDRTAPYNHLKFSPWYPNDRTPYEVADAIAEDMTQRTEAASR